MQFVLFRHAHKGSLPYDDPELSPQGFVQASLIPKLIVSKTLPQPTHLFVSPKRRTSQTFYHISKEFNVQNEIHIELDQRGPQENSIDFKNRIQSFLMRMQNFTQSDSVIFACTHYDWIEESMALINCDNNLNSFEFSHWSPAQYLLFEVHNSYWKILKKGNVK